MSWKLARENYLNDSQKIITRRSAAGYSSPVRNKALGTGTIFDKVQGGHNVLLPNSFENKSQLEVMYHELPLAKICVSAIVEDAFKNWRDYISDQSTSTVDAFTEEWDRVGLSESLKELAIMSRVFGTALGIIVIKDQELSEPLDPETVTPQSLIGLRTFDRFLFHIDPNDIVTELDADNFGMPVFYNLVTGLSATDGSDQYVPIHYTRVVRLDGEKNLSVASLSYNRLWGLPILAAAMTEILRDYAIAGSISQILTKIGMGVATFQGLKAAAKGRGVQKTSMFDSLDEKISSIEHLSSSYRMIALADGDGYELLQASTGGLGQLLAQYALRLSMVLRIPATRLWGRSPEGMNATGEYDEALWADMVKSYQVDLDNNLAILDDVVARSAGVDLPEWEYSTVTPQDDKAEAETASFNIQTLATAISIGVTTAEEVRATLDGHPLFGEMKDPLPEDLLTPEEMLAASTYKAEMEKAKMENSGSQSAPNIDPNNEKD